ncbi:hypothetical protein EHI42_05690 [Rhizobium hidalgonense]|nr:hypothetical protein EHI42_05690 [Rhizobium hidalgonense]
MQVKTYNPGGNAHQSERRVQNSNPHSISELEPSFEPKQGATSEDRSEGWAVPIAQIQKDEEKNEHISAARAVAAANGGLKFPAGIGAAGLPRDCGLRPPRGRSALGAI